MTSQHPARTQESVYRAKHEDVVAFSLLAFAMVLFLAWPKGSRGTTYVRRRPHDERPGHPYRSAAKKPPVDRTWIFHVRRRDDDKPN